MIKIKQAVILAGGMGKRLRPLTYKAPKPMVLVNNRPFLEYLIELLKLNGIEEILLLIGYKHQKIIDYFKDGSDFGVRIKYSIGTDLHITGARLKRAGSLLDKYFLLLYCDNYWPLNLKHLVEYHKKKKKLITVTIYSNKDSITKNNILVGKNGLVKRYDPERKSEDLNGVEIGFFIVNKKVLDLFSPDFHFEKEIFSLLIPKKQISGYLTEDRYYSIGDLTKFKETKKFSRFWTSPSTPRDSEPGGQNDKKVIFLDRDGVINKKMPKGKYVKKWKEFKFIPGTIEALKILSKKNYNIFLITNQAGVGRGVMSKKDLDEIHSSLKKELKRNDVKIKDIYYCPHDWSKKCICRKPKPGMLLKAASDYNFDLSKAIFIGDDERDLQAGLAAGCKTIILKPEENLLKIARSLM